jgi:hypothetical protein
MLWLISNVCFSILHVIPFSRILVIAMTGAAISIDDATAIDTVLSVKERLFSANYQLHVHRQRLMYRPGPHGMEPLADDETLGGAGVVQDGSAELDVLLAETTAEDLKALGLQVSFVVTRSSSWS